MIFTEVSARLFPWDFIDEKPDDILDNLERDTLTNSFYPVILYLIFKLIYFSERLPGRFAEGKHQAASTRYIAMCKHNSLLPSVRTSPRRTISGERTRFRAFSRSTSRSSPTPMSRSMLLPTDVSAWIASRRWSKTLSHAATILKVSPASSAPTLNVERSSSVPSVAKAFISALPVHRSERSSLLSTWRMTFYSGFHIDW